MNISSFSNENYNIVDWVNEYFKFIDEKDHYKKIHNAIAKLHVIMQEIYDSLNSLCLNSSEPILNVHSELIKISQEVTVVENECREFNFKYQEEVANRFDETTLNKILKLQRAKSTLKSIKKVIEETQHWKLLIAQCNNAIENKDIEELLEKYSKIRQIMYLMQNSPKNKEETQEISNTTLKIEIFIKIHLSESLNQINEVKSKELFNQMMKFGHQQLFTGQLLEVRSKILISLFDQSFINVFKMENKQNIRLVLEKLYDFSIEINKNEINYVKKSFDFQNEQINNYLLQLHSILIVDIKDKISLIFSNIDDSHDYVEILAYIESLKNQISKDQIEMNTIFEIVTTNLMKDHHYSIKFLNKIMEKYKKLNIMYISDNLPLKYFNLDILITELDSFLHEISFIFMNVIKFESFDITSFDIIWVEVKKCFEMLLITINNVQNKMQFDIKFSTFFNFYFTITSFIGKFLKTFNNFTVPTSMNNLDSSNSNLNQIFKLIKIDIKKWHEIIYDEINIIFIKYMEYNFSILINEWIKFYTENDKNLELSLENPSNTVLMIAESIFDVARQLELFLTKNTHLQVDILWFMTNSNQSNDEMELENWKYSFLKKFSKEFHQLMFRMTNKINFKYENTLKHFNLDKDYLSNIYDDINDENQEYTR